VRIKKIMNGEKLNTLKCNNCSAESPAGSIYCTECGNPLPKKRTNTESMKSVCPHCYAEFDDDIDFCKECGTKTKKITYESDITICLRCYSEIGSDLKYCPVCSSCINSNTSSDKLCPKCLKEVPPGRPYCLYCGTPVDAKKSLTTKIREKLKSHRDSIKKNPQDQPLISTPSTRNDSIQTGDNYVIDEEVGKTSAPQHPPISWEKVNQIIEDEKEKDLKPGYLICNSCGDYYELKLGESPDEFICECSCGGILVHKLEL
jgi:rRNA maturation endonuclease Nob1